MIELHKKDLFLLLTIAEFFCWYRKDSSFWIKKVHVVYTVSSIKDLHSVIIPHSMKYPLLTIKRFSFIFFIDIIELLVNKQHLEKKGLLKIMSIRTCINNDVSSKLLSSFNCF